MPVGVCRNLIKSRQLENLKRSSLSLGERELLSAVPYNNKS
jgi:hypothetical protein